jgi:alpha-glucosidase (family GH31 glycosyl hydrolase)
MRGIFVDHPHDEAAWAHPHEFLLGDDVLVSPVTEPGVSRWSTYLPAGNWVDAWDGSRHGGGQVVDRPAPRDVVPVYLRAEAEAALRPLFGA